jgi:hypothetical protein
MGPAAYPKIMKSFSLARSFQSLETQRSQRNLKIKFSLCDLCVSSERSERA